MLYNPYPFVQIDIDQTLTQLKSVIMKDIYFDGKFNCDHHRTLVIIELGFIEKKLQQQKKEFMIIGELC